jgi:hypothetical protein
MDGLIREPYARAARHGRLPAAHHRHEPSDVAEAIWRAANDTTGQLRFPAPTRWHWHKSANRPRPRGGRIPTRPPTAGA